MPAWPGWITRKPSPAMQKTKRHRRN